MLFDRARWPANDRPEVPDAPCCGVRSVATPGASSENPMKLRPLIGRCSNLLLRDHARDDRPLRVDDRRVSRDEHDLLAPGDVQRQADIEQAAERQHDILERARRKPLQLRSHVIRARRQRRNQKMPALVGHRAASLVRVDVLRRHGRAGEHGGRLIDDRPAKIGRRGARLPCRDS